VNSVLCSRSIPSTNPAVALPAFIAKRGGFSHNPWAKRRLFSEGGRVEEHELISGPKQ
jgi:hypothetical protein